MPTDLALGTPTATDQPITNTGGTGVTLPSATATTAGLLDATGKTILDNLTLHPPITQGGNTFGASVVIGAKDNNSISFLSNNNTVGVLDNGGNFALSSVKNISGSNFAYVGLLSSGVMISRSVVDTNPPLIVNRNGGTGTTQLWQNAGTQIAYMDGQGILGCSAVKNAATGNNAYIALAATGIFASRNVADSNPAMILNQQNSASTGNILTLQKNTITVAQVNTNGAATFPKLAVNTSLTAPTAMLDVDAGTSAAATILGSFAQNSGNVQILNNSSSAGTFSPTIKAASTGSAASGLTIKAQGSNTYSTGAITLNSTDSTGSGPVSGGNTFAVQNNNSNQLAVDSTGTVTINNLAGTGTRIVNVNSSGALSATAAIPVANGGTGLTSAGSPGQTLVSNGTSFVLTTPAGVSSGTYSPTISGSATYVASGFRFTQIGNIVHGGGRVNVTGCVVGNNVFIFDLPVNTAVSDLSDVTGTVSGANVGAPTSSGPGNCVIAYFSSIGMASVSFVATDNNAQVYIEYTYIVQ